MTEKFSEDFQAPIIEQTVSLLREDERSLEEISRATDISVYWLQAVAQRKIKQPAINRIWFLYEFLTKTKIVLPEIEAI